MTHTHGMHANQPNVSRRALTRARRHRQHLIMGSVFTCTLLFISVFTILPHMQTQSTPISSSVVMSRTIGGTTRFIDTTVESQAASRDSAREPLSTRTDTTDGQWDSVDIDTDKLTIRHANNPLIKQLINERDEHTLPSSFNPDHTTGDTGENTYPYGQCTWWTYQRRHEIGLPTGGRLGNAQDWATNARKLGYWVDNTPRQYDVVVFHAGQQGADPTYGHVAVVEHVHENGSITISEANVNGQVGPFQRDITQPQAAQLTYIHY